ncbi:helix-turn-helix transcriptional regulator [Lactiplantibacillus plantarum]|uniref:helix-turn-helix transcriptional regulator n=1 Tax=Lactiplantibacillus plantarum TaxID=1590 RepID=UPI000B3C4389|nr:helix-turn-helix transcriptional regulator [Lactiplantibacillus plantarum]MCS8623036.1 XRE family transcriptional regulator [Lactiplantibacillus plantarum]MCT4441546.1 XRE family transcriptional regulator [Lactiplantibacillus plantarum]
MQFANVLRKKRKELHLTQQQLADKLHVTRQTLSRWENNLSYPNLDTVDCKFNPNFWTNLSA